MLLGRGFRVAVRERVCDGFQATQVVLHGEVESEEYADPLVLRHG